MSSMYNCPAPRPAPRPIVIDSTPERSIEPKLLSGMLHSVQAGSSQGGCILAGVAEGDRGALVGLIGQFHTHSGTFVALALVP